jgi:hypothetical protein
MKFINCISKLFGKMQHLTADQIPIFHKMSQVSQFHEVAGNKKKKLLHFESSKKVMKIFDENLRQFQ